MFNKLKAKLAEELDSETESNAEYGGGDRTAVGAAQGSPADQVRALEAEVRELKEHINKNYFVYVKRLEKRKERIKELEEYAKLVVKDNEALNDKLKELEECQTQLGRARDNLDELEGFQSQELAKVKHMLLSAETALEKETRERKELGERVAKGEREAERLRLETSRREAKWLEKEKGWEARVEEVRREEEAKVQRLQERLSNQDLSGDERLDAVIDERDRMEVELRSAEAECAALQKRLVEANEQAEAAQVESEQAREDLSKMKQEKDALRSSVLELEIANHEHQNSENADINGLKMEVAKLNTEKETLEMTLDLRDRELKAKKEEFRGDLALLESRKSELEQEVDAKSSRVSALEAELTVLKEKLAESSRDLSSVNSKMAVHEERAMQMEEASRNKDESLTSLRSELEEERRSAIGAAEALSELEVRYSEVVADYEKVVLELGDVSKAKAELERSVTEKTSEADNLSDRVRSLEGVIKEQEDSFPERVEATQLVRDLRKQLLEAEDDLADKKKVQTVRKIIKIHCICNLVFTGNQAAWSANSRHKEDYAKGDEGHDDDVAGGERSHVVRRGRRRRRRQGVVHAHSSPAGRRRHRALPDCCVLRRGAAGAVAAAAGTGVATVCRERQRRDRGDDGGQLQVSQARHIQVLHVAGVRGAALDPRHLRPAQVHLGRGEASAGAPRVEDELVRREAQAWERSVLAVYSRFVVTREGSQVI